jgi:hypothetical protein
MSTTSKATVPSAILAAAALLAVGPARAQFTEFQGGKLHLEMEGNMSPFGLASNTGARGAMSNVTTLYPSASSLFGNPAGLSDVKGLSVQTDFFLPGLGLGVSSERTKVLRNNLRTPIQDFLKSGDNDVEHPVYPDVDLGLYQSTNLSGFAVAFGGPRTVLSAGVQQSFRGSVDFGLGGLRLGLGLPEDASDPQSDSIKVLLSTDAFARLTAELNDFSLGIAAKPWKDIPIGFAYHRYTADLLFEAGARVDGILRRAGQESFFHGEGVNYHDDLDAKGYGQVTGAANGFRLGTGWRFWNRFGVDAMLSMVESMKLDGDVSAEYNMLPSVDFGGGKILDPSKMNPTKLTLTTRTKHVLQDMEILLPWEGALSLSGKWENFKVNLDYSYFLRGMSIRFTSLDSADVYDTTTKDIARNSAGGDSVETSRDNHELRLGLEQQFAVGLQIYQVFLQLGGIVYSVGSASALAEATAYKPDWLPFLPTMNMGYFFPLGPNFTVTVSLVAFPVSLFKTSVEYRY